MSITETKQALGSWSLALRRDTPREILDALTYFGHIAIVAGHTNVPEAGDNLLAVSRYVGVFRGRSANDGFLLEGAGLALWLGDEDGKGDVLETAVVLNAQTFANSITALLPPSGSITAGTIYAVPGGGTYTGRHQYETSRKAITYITDTYSTAAQPVEWKINNNGTLDAGPVANLYVTVPTALIMRRKGGRDLTRLALPGMASLSKDVNDYTTRVVLLAEGEGSTIVTGDADAVGVAAKDLHGNTVKFTRIVSESDTSATNADARAQLMLSRFSNARTAVELSTSAYDVKSDFVVGDYVDVYDPDNGFVDPTREVVWEGQAVNPVALRCVEMTWPVLSTYTVAFRDTNGVWIDLTPYFVPETGDTSIVVGDLAASWSGVGSEPIGSRPSVDTSTPATPVFATPFSSAAYQSAAANDIRASVRVTWAQPLNTDGTTILDGSHYEIRYRTTETYNYPILWSQGAAFRWNQLQTWGRPLSNPAAASGEWQVQYVPWGQTAVMINELVVAAEYEFQIRAVDAATPPNPSPWSASVFLTTGTDLIPPGQPAAPEVASSLIALQVTHSLGLETGGTFNLPADLHHLEVHVGGGPAFWVHEATLVGTIIANAGNLTSQVPVIGTFQVEYTDEVYVRVVAVDRFGNKSSASEGVQATTLLIDDAHIGSLTATKITAGTISSSVILSGSIKTAESGQRVEMNQQGLQLYDANGELVVNLTADDSTPNFISITDGLDSTLSSMDQDGNITGQTISAAQAITLAGSDLQTGIIDPLPRGIVAQGVYPGGSPNIGPAALNTELGAFELSFVAEAGRMYRVTFGCQLQTSFNGATAEQSTLKVRDGGENTPTTSSQELYRHEFYGPTGTNSGFSTGTLIYESADFTAGLHRLLFSFMNRYGTATLRPDNDPAVMTIEDIGSSLLVPNTLIVNNGSGSAPPPVTNYTKTYNATWYQTYNESGGKKDDSTANQGRYSSLDGNQRSLIGFPYSSIMSDLSGATVTKVELTLNNEHWYYNAGGDAVIGTHDYTSEPSSWSGSRVDEDRLRSNNWAKGAKKTVSLGTSIGNDFKDGDAKGIALGPGPSTSLDYYGKFSGTGASSSDRPTLKIYYTK